MSVPVNSPMFLGSSSSASATSKKLSRLYNPSSYTCLLCSVTVALLFPAVTEGGPTTSTDPIVYRSLVAAKTAAPSPKPWWQRHNELRERFHNPFDKHERPPTGAVYVGTMKMPVIGRQTFMLRLLGWQRCQIVLIGPLALDEPAAYSERFDANGVITLDMHFNEPTIDLLRRWRTRIKATRWHKDGDYAELVVSPPLIRPIKIKMWRTAPRDAPKPPKERRG